MRSTPSVSAVSDYFLILQVKSDGYFPGESGDFFAYHIRSNKKTMFTRVEKRLLTFVTQGGTMIFMVREYIGEWCKENKSDHLTPNRI